MWHLIKSYWDSAEISPDQTRYFLCLLLSYLFSLLYFKFLLYARVPAALKHIYLAGISHLFILICFEKKALAHLYTPIVLTYLIAKHFKGKRWMPLLVFTITLGQLAYHHLHRQLYAGDTLYILDYTGPLMMLVIKLTTFVFYINDAAARGPTAKVKFPGLLEFCGYAFLFTGFLTGPVISFNDYRQFISRTIFQGRDVRKSVGRKRRALRQFTISLAFMVIFVCFKTLLPISFVTEKAYLAKPLWYRLMYLHFANLIQRSKYYFAWLIAEGSYVIIGLGFRLVGTDSSRLVWNRLENVDPLKIETASDFRKMVSEWNICTNQWLYHCVYKRLAKPGNKPGFKSNLTTYVVSAFWHGFYPGYYVVFVTGALMTYLTKMIYRTTTWPFDRHSRKIFCYIPNYIVTDYFITPFSLLTWSDSWAFMRGVHFYGHIAIVLGLAVVALLPKAVRVARIRRARSLVNKP